MLLRKYILKLVVIATIIIATISYFIKPFEEKAPEIVFEWIKTQGWLLINFLSGDTRIRKGLIRHELTSLAKKMGINFLVKLLH